MQTRQIIDLMGKRSFREKIRFEKYEKCEWDYALFPWDFLPSVGTTAGAAFAGATTFFSLFDVVITSFSVFFDLWFATYSCSLGTGIYALPP